MSRKRPRHRMHANPFTIRGDITPLDIQETFGRAAPLALDVGCGPGAFAAELARQHPEWNVLALEIRQHFVDDVLAKAEAAQLGNLHAMLANANLHMQELIPDHSLAFVSVNFPDPWFKKRHHKRRVVSPEWVELLTRKLLPGAEIHAMSDFGPIAEQMLETFGGHQHLRNLDGVDRFAQKSTTGIMTEREETHQQRGERIYRMRFIFEDQESAALSVGDADASFQRQVVNSRIAPTL